jgi:DNA-binding response OmpR family regulator
MEELKKIIIIEDDKDINELIAYNLRRAGFLVEQAFDGEKGLSMVKKNSPALIILDIMLPKMDGYDFLGKIKKDDSISNIPVIIVSAKNSPGAIIRGFNLGAADYIPKPFNIGELILKVKIFWPVP